MKRIIEQLFSTSCNFGNVKCLFTTGFLFLLIGVDNWGSSLNPESPECFNIYYIFRFISFCFIFFKASFVEMVAGIV